MTDGEYNALLRFPWSRFRTRIVLLAFLTVVVIALLPWHEVESVLTFAAQSWTVSDEIGPASAVVVLDGGAARPYAAARLYRSGMVHTVLVDSDDNRKLMLGLGVPPNAVEVFGKDLSNTYEEACALAGWAGKNDAQRIIIPTELFFSRRVKWIFTHKLESVGTEIMVDVVPLPQYAADNWWSQEDGRVTFGKEFIKYLFYRARYLVSTCPAYGAPTLSTVAD
jgi:uncharacterized SAM-binding protein YcdF (DUF218 family)